MNPDVIQFQCHSCQTVLTVPGHMAGISGPCPNCGKAVTSPAATPGFAGGFPAAPPAPHIPSAPPPPQGLGGQSPLLGQRAPGMGAFGGAPPQGPVLPHPHISQHLTPPPATPPSAFSGQRLLGGSPETPPWHQPGLGQTLLGGHPAPAPTPAAPANAGSFLPPRRPEGQAPVAGGGTPGSPANLWGAGGAMGAAPSLPPQPMGPRGEGAYPSPGGFGGGAPAQDPRALWGNGGGPVPAPPGIPPGAAIPPPQQMQQPAGRHRKGDRQAPLPYRSGRGSSILRIGLASLFLVGFLGAGAWFFREPLREAANRYASSKGNPEASNRDREPSAEEEIPHMPAPPTPADSPPLALEPPPANKSPSPGRFDPNETTVPKAEPASPGDLASLSNVPSASNDPAAPNRPLGGLMEVPSKQVEASIQSDSSRDATTALVKTDIRIEAPPEAMPAAEALRKFLNASNIEERMRYTLAPDAMRKFMDRYYSVHPDGPINVDTIGYVRLDPKPQIGGGAHAVFGLESRAWQFPVPVMLEEGKDGFRVDWLSFVEFKDRLLERFFKEYSEGPARFHVGITRTHYFDDTVPNADNKDAFRVSSAPPNPFLATVFVDKDSAVGLDLKDKIPWGAQVWAIAELEWLRLGSQKWVELAAVPQLNWYSVPVAAKTPQPARSPSSPTEIQRAVPIGR